MKRAFLPSLGVLTIALSLLGCGRGAEAPAAGEAQPPAPRLRVGFSQLNYANPWRIAETNDFRREAQARGIELVFTDAESSAEKQVRDVEQLLALGVDYLVVAPIVEGPLRPAILAARRAGIPLILVDRMADAIPGEEFLTFVGSDFNEEGRRSAEWLARKMEGRARIVELRGRQGSSPEIGRGSGFREVIALHPGMEIVISRSAIFERLEGQKVMEDIILTLGRGFDAVYAHNDEMAIGAIQALKAAGIRPGKDVILVSIDGEKDALKAIIAGELGASVECTPRFARRVFEVIEAHRRGEPVPPKITNPDRLYDIGNAREHLGDAF